jgi:multidrug resistance protein MdtO
MYPFESFPKKPHESLVNRSIRTLLPELRAFLLIKTGLVQHRSLAVTRTEDLLIQEVDDVASRALHRVANAIETESAEELSSGTARTEEVREKVFIEGERVKDRENQQRYTEMRLSASLLDLASNLERQARLNVTHHAGVGDSIGAWSVGPIPSRPQG